MNQLKIEKWILELEQNIDNPIYSRIEEYTRCRDLCMILFLQLKEEIKTCGFKNSEEEIIFFKKLKPQLVSKFFYYMKLMVIEARIPIGSDDLKIDYFKEEQNKLDNYYRKHADFCHYIQSQETHLDHIYFIRGQHHICHFGEYLYIEMDTDFATSYDFILARLMANEDIHKFLQSKIQRLKNAAHSINLPEQKLRWTSTKTDMVELIYALHESGSIPDDISRIVNTFQIIFKIDLGEFYKTWSSIRIRKKDKTTFINKMKEQLLHKMECYDD